MFRILGRFFRGELASGRLICHVGPPKTATTAIQESLQKISAADFCYLGTLQPRARNRRNSIYYDLIYLINSQSTSESDDQIHQQIDKIQRKINRKISFGTDVIISEEMLLVNQNGVNFEQKLHRLGQCISKYDCVIVITLREPVSALKSLYSEIYFRQKKSPSITFEEFLGSSQARVFDYPYLLTVLKKSGFDNVRFLSIQNEGRSIVLGDFTGRPHHNEKLQMEASNATEYEFRKKAKELVVPDDLKSHLSLGYTQIIEKFVRHAPE